VVLTPIFTAESRSTDRRPATVDALDIVAVADLPPFLGCTQPPLVALLALIANGPTLKVEKRPVCPARQ